MAAKRMKRTTCSEMSEIEQLCNSRDCMDVMGNSYTVNGPYLV